MVSFNTFASAVEQHFTAEFTLLFPSVPIHYDDAPISTILPGAFVRLSVIEGIRELGSLGSPSTNRRVISGAVLIQIFTSENSGNGYQATLSDAIANIFETANLTKTQFRDIVVTQLGVDQYGRKQKNLSVQYTYN